MQHNQKKQYGSAIIEVLIAAFIFAGALWGFIEFQTNLLRERNLIKERTEALTLIENKMRYFRSYTVLTTTPGQLAYSDIVTCAAACSGGTSKYPMTWTVTDQTAPTRKSVQISVTWTDNQNAPHTVTMNSIIASIDPSSQGKVSQGL